MRNTTSKNSKKEYIEEFLRVLDKIGSDNKLREEFMLDMLTPSEIEELGLRWQIIKRLAKGVSHREIGKELKISISTISRGSRELSDPNGGFEKVLKKLKII